MHYRGQRAAGHCGVMNAITLESGEVAYEHEGMLWKAREGCTSTFDELASARSRWLEIFHETQWNPWRKEELQPEADRAYDVMDEWTRAEPGHRMMTDDEVTAWMVEMRRESDAQHAADEARWVKDTERYSPEREGARYELLERQAMRARLEGDLEAYRSGTRFPGMQADARAKEIAKIAADLERNEHEISRLSAIVGDPEDVVDSGGRLPRDRRPLHRVGYDVSRRFEVEELQALIAEQREKVAVTKGRKEKSALEGTLWMKERRLAALLAVPRLVPDDMCSECDTPPYQHMASNNDERRSCPQWPMQTARMKQAFENLRFVLDRASPAEPEPPKPQPLATLPGNLPIGEVIARLSELQAAHPEAVVKRGRANRWELWPGER